MPGRRYTVAELRAREGGRTAYHRAPEATIPSMRLPAAHLLRRERTTIDDTPTTSTTPPAHAADRHGHATKRARPGDPSTVALASGTTAWTARTRPTTTPPSAGPPSQPSNSWPPQTTTVTSPAVDSADAAGDLDLLPNPVCGQLESVTCPVAG